MNKKVLAVLITAFITLSFSVAATTALVPAIAGYFGVAPVSAGRLIWMYMLPYGFFALLWSPLTHKFKISRLFAFNMAMFSLAALGMSFCWSIYAAFAFRFLMGVFASSFVPLSLIIVGKEVPAGKKSKYIGILFSLSFFSSLAGLFLSGILFWRIIYFIPAVLAGIACFWIVFSLRMDYRRQNLTVSYVSTLKDRTVFRLFAFITAGSFIYHSIQQWLAVFMAQEYHFSQFKVSSALTMASLSAIAAESAGGVLCTKIGISKVVEIGFFLMISFLGVLILFYKNLNAEIFLAVLLWGFGWALTHVGLSSVLTHLPDKFLRDASSLNSALRFFSGGLGAFFGGRIISLVGFKYLFCFAGILILGLVILLERKGVENAA